VDSSTSTPGSVASPPSEDSPAADHVAPPSNDPVTLSIARRITPGMESDFQSFIEGISEAIERYPGFIDARRVPPTRGDNTYRLVIRFDSERNLRAWKESDERRAWYAIGDEFSDDAALITNITGTAQERPLVLALTPLQGFVQTSVSGIGLLLLGTLLALLLANSPASDMYDRFWAANLTIGVPSFGITESVRHWINDGLMALFFFIMGLEIKREILVGELRYPRQAALPIAAAVGGVIVPALTFSAINLGGDGAMGWGIPMATDTAFALGVLTLFGGRVRPLLLVFLTAFAIVDDILSVGVIAVFYTDAIHWRAAGVAVALLGVLMIANRAGFQRWPVYGIVGLGVWVAVFESGIHGTVAGILVAMTVPAQSWINPSEFLIRARQAIADFERACFIAPSILSNEPQQQATQALERLCEDVETPMTHLQHRVNPVVAFAILPIFAFANAGIPIVDGFGNALSSAVTWGVIVGLIIAKPIGITLFAWIAVRTGLAIKPRAITWTQLASVAVLGGIGFTVSLFVTELAFAAGPNADDARIGILLGSLAAGAAGYLVLRRTLPAAPTDPA
jgi:NhaA family Na+:H+ antiporter